MTDRPTADVLARFRLFDGLSRPTLERIAAAAAPNRLADGDSLFEQGGEPRDLYLVTRGRLALRVADGDRWTTVQSVEAEDLLGWSALRADARWLTTARALGPVEVTAIPLATMLDVIEAGGPDARRLAQSLFGVGAAHLDAIRQQLQQPVRDAIITGG
jgi:CRP-like cAMP-binding protein